MRKNLAIAALSVLTLVMLALVWNQHATLAEKERDLDLLRARKHPPRTETTGAGDAAGWSLRPVPAAPPAPLPAAVPPALLWPATAPGPGGQPPAVPVPVAAAGRGPEPSPAAGTGESRKPTFMQALADMVQSEGMKDIMAATQEMQINTSYGTLIDYFGTQNVEPAVFRKLLVDRQLALVEASMAVMKRMGGDDADPAAGADAVAAVRAVQADHDARIAKVLGEENYAVFTEFEQTQPEREQVRQFARMLPADQQLTGTQEHDLIRALYEERQSYAQEKQDPYDREAQLTGATLDPAGMRATLAGMGELNNRYREKAGTVLTESQWAAYRRFQQQMEAMQQAGMKMAEALMNEQAAASATATEETAPGVNVRVVAP